MAAVYRTDGNARRKSDAMSAALFVDGSFLRKAWREFGGHSLLRYEALRAVVERETCDTSVEHADQLY